MKAPITASHQMQVYLYIDISFRITTCQLLVTHTHCYFITNNEIDQDDFGKSGNIPLKADKDPPVASYEICRKQSLFK